jgi:dTDP-4-amino-4,6-dideoxygalactose transaminase
VCDADQIEAAARVLRSGRLNYWTGTEGRQFEREFADAVKTKHAVALANGTVALELAMWALGIGPGDEVIVPCRTFVATASAVARCGARPVFADVDADSQTITADTIRLQLTPRTKAVVVVHLGGWPCEMDEIVELARGHRVAVVEDCAQAHGARYRDRPVGSIGDVGAFSFCQDKIITTAGEGGMLVTNDTKLWQRAWSFKDHGKSFDAAHAPHRGFGFRWLHERIGTNWRLTEVQSAIGRVAMRKLNAWVDARRRNASILNNALSRVPLLRTTSPPPHAQHSYYKYYAFIRRERLAPNWSRDRVLEEINLAGVPCFAGSCSEVYLEQAFDSAYPPPHRLPVARELGETSLMFQVHPTLTDTHMRTAAEVAADICRRAATPIVSGLTVAA